MLPLLLSDVPASEQLAGGEPLSEAERAVLHALLKESAQAEEALARAREGAPGPDARLAAALVAMCAGDAARARFAAQQAGDEPMAHALWAEASLLLGRPDEALARLGPEEEAHPYGRIVAAEASLRSGDAARALELLTEGPAAGLLGARSKRLRAEARLASDPPDARSARDDLSAAVWQLMRLRLPDELARCYLVMADLEGAHGSNERAAEWLARSHGILVPGGTSQDLARLRRAFRRFGRRTLDRLVADDLEAVIEESRSALARVIDLRAAVRDASAEGGEAEAAEAELSTAIAALGDAGEALITALEGLVLDREEVGKLVAVSREVLTLETETDLDRALPGLALELGAEAAVVVSLGAQPSVLAAAGASPIDLGAAREATARASSGDQAGPDEPLVTWALTSEADPRVLAVRRRRLRSGALAEAERHTVLASLARTAYERARQAHLVREAGARDRATIEAIREGIVSLSSEGTVRSLNAAAAALLRAPPSELVGRPLASWPGLRSLAEAIARGVEDDSVTLPEAEALVRARRYEGGVVVTLQDLGRARQLAQKLVGGGARFTFADLLGRDPAFLDTLADARRVADTDVPILITGESGTGKELLAQAIHNASPRSPHSFVGVNVAAIPRELLESELFGYERGAFTGARERGHAGRFELADRGTLLLDEIGDMPLEMQAKLLRVLQERVVHRLGSSRGMPVHARIIATTHRDLERAVRDGAFRLDLFYRLRVVHLRLPPLRERAGDVRLLVERQIALISERSGRAPVQVRPAVIADLERYEWPGNVRELANLVEGVLTLLPAGAREWVETPVTVRRALSRPPPSGGEAVEPAADSADAPIEALEIIERRAVERALAAFGGNVAKSARALGVARGTLYNMMKRHGLA